MITRRRLIYGFGTFAVLCAAAAGLLAYLLFQRVEGQYFESNGVRIHYTMEGQGEPVILVHGVVANADMNWRYPGVTRLLAKNFRVIAMDLRGHGLSDKPTDPEQYGIQMVEEIPRLMDHLHLEKAHVAGYSLGGFLVQKLLAVHPERVASAAICAAGWKNPEDPSPVPNPYKAPAESNAAHSALASVSAAPSPKPPFHRIRNWAGDHLMDKTVKKALKQKYEDLAVPKVDLEKIRVPMICLIGTRDGFLPLARDLCANVPNMECVEIVGSGHFTTPFRGPFKEGLRYFFLSHSDAFSSHSSALPAQTHEAKLRILTWNIQMLPATFAILNDELQKMQKERAPWIVEYLNAQDYDVICLQEAFDSKAIKILKKGLAEQYPYVVEPQYGSRWRPYSNGVLFLSRVPIRYVAHTMFEGLERVERWTSKGCCLVEGEKDGVAFQIAGTHFPTGKQRIKDAAIANLHEKLLLPHRCDAVPQFLVGDFNTAKGTPEYEALLKITETTDHPVDNLRPYSSDPNNRWKAGKTKKMALIDHVLVNPSGTATAVAHETIQRATHEYQGSDVDLSDHYGVVANVVVSNKKQAAGRIDETPNTIESAETMRAFDATHAMFPGELRMEAMILYNTVLSESARPHYGD